MNLWRISKMNLDELEQLIIDNLIELKDRQDLLGMQETKGVYLAIINVKLTFKNLKE
jgi:hypothetical protein